MARKKFSPLNLDAKGFLLAEVLTALVLIALTLPLLAGVLHLAAQANRSGSSEALEAYEARMVVARILKELRESGRVVSAPEGSGVLLLENQAGELIRYERTGGVVYRTYNTAKVPWSEGVYRLEFALRGELVHITAGGEGKVFHALGAPRALRP